MRIAVCDDEKEIRDLLGEKIQRLYPQGEIALYASGEELLLSHMPPDILLLDIQMPGKNGMETAKELKESYRDTILIFITGLEDFVMCQAERRNYRQKFFLAVTFFALRWFIFAAANIIYDQLYNFWGNTAYMRSHPNQFFVLYVGMVAFHTILAGLLMGAGVWCLLKAYTDKHSDMTKKELAMLSVPPLTGVCGYAVLRYYRDFYIIETHKMQNVYDAFTLLYYGVSVVTMLVVITLYQRIKAGQQEKLQNEMLAAQVESIRQHIEQVEEIYQDIRSLRHDMANHILTLERLYEGNKKEEARNYSADLKEKLTWLTGEIKSGNPVTDVILWEAQKEAEQRKIRFCSEFYYPEDAGLNAFDISVILNNALQNAMEHGGQGEDPYIYIRSYQRNHVYMIEVCNSFTGTLQWDRERGLPLTSKEEEGHGYGLSNIRKMAEKYFGDIAIDIKDGAFCLSVMLRMD